MGLTIGFLIVMTLHIHHHEGSSVNRPGIHEHSQARYRH
jgi:hypothetical protein